MSQNKKKYTIGIDIGGTKILAALFDDRFQIISEIKSKTKPEKGDGHFLGILTDSIKFLLRDGRVSRSEIAGIGMGCPGFIDTARGVVLGSPNIPFLKSYPLARKLAGQTDLPVVIGNDVQTGLYGEHQFGAARGYQHVVGIFMGTGIGGALILNGQLYRGTSGSAGEVGHVLFDSNGPFCGCGQRGCVEAFAGRMTIAAEAAVAVTRQMAPHLAQKAGTDIRDIKSGALAKAIQAGDQAIAAIMKTKAQVVGTLMANLVTILNPQLVVLGGGVVEAMPGLIVREAEQVMRRLALGTSSRHVRVAAAKLQDHSVVMGAAKQAFDRLIERRKGDRRG